MTSSVRLLRRYVWLIDTIRRTGHITLEEINRKWLDERSLRLEDDAEIPEGTFHRHRQAIADIFGIDILCNRSNGNTYYIENEEALSTPSFTSWLFNGLSIDNQLLGNRDIASRVIFEDTPGGMEYMPTVIEAMTRNRYLDISYRKFHSADEKRWEIVPLLLQQSSRRWYLIAQIEGQTSFTTFALDRITSVRILDREAPDRSDIDAIKRKFDEVIAINLDDDFDCEKVVLRVYGNQRTYIETLPLHPSQRIKKTGEDFTDYEYNLRPEYQFQHEILRLGRTAEILAPAWLRDEVHWLATEIAARYAAGN